MIGGAQKKDRSQRRRSEQGPGPLAALALTRRREPLFFSPVTRPWLLCGTPRLGASSVSGRTRALADPTRGRPGSPFGGRVDALLGHDGELFVRSLLLGEILPQHRGAVPASKLPRPRCRRPLRGCRRSPGSWRPAPPGRACETLAPGAAPAFASRRDGFGGPS